MGSAFYRRMIAGLFVLGVGVTHAGSSDEVANGIAGVGARPLTDTLAATWFIERVSPPSEYRMSLVVFLRGAPGWTKEKADWKWGSGEPAYSSFAIAGHPFRVEYSKTQNQWSTLGANGPATEANVIVVEGLGTADQHIVHREHMDLVVPFESDPLREVLSRSASLRKALALE